jgi:hypothetical protein
MLCDAFIKVSISIPSTNSEQSKFYVERCSITFGQ